MNGDRNNWAPRAGFAWRVPKAKDLVIRSSFGIFYAQDQGTGVTNRMTSNPPFFGYGAQTLSSDQLFPSSGFVLSSNASISPTPIDPSAFTLNPASTATLVSWPSGIRTRYVAQWSFSVQKRLPWDLLAEVNYVGNHGVQILGIGEGNQPLVLAATTVTSRRRPLAGYTAASVKAVGNWNMSYYEGLSSKIEKRFQSGVSFLSTFTYGHALDSLNPALDLCDGCGSGDTMQDNYHRFLNRSSSDNDVRLRYVLAGSFELPFGKGKPLLANSKWGSATAGGWRLVAIFQAQTGLPGLLGWSCPGSFESAGKRLSGKTRKGSHSLRRGLCQAAWALS